MGQDEALKKSTESARLLLFGFLVAGAFADLPGTLVMQDHALYAWNAENPKPSTLQLKASNP